MKKKGEYELSLDLNWTMKQNELIVACYFTLEQASSGQC